VSQTPSDDFSNASLLELFRQEAEKHGAAMVAALLELERDPAGAKILEALMRGAHSLKGGASIVQLPVVARLAHGMEDCFVAAQAGKIRLERRAIDLLLRGVDFFMQIAKTPDAKIAEWETGHATEVDVYLPALKAVIEVHAGESPKPAQTTVVKAAAVPAAEPVHIPAPDSPASGEMLRLPAETVNRLLGLAGETVVESRRLQPLNLSLHRLNRLQSGLASSLDGLRRGLTAQVLGEGAGARLRELDLQVKECQAFLSGRIEELDEFDRRAARISRRLYQEALQCRMRPFGDGVRQFPRMVRDLARALGKEVRLEVGGENTQVDRDILEKLDAPLTHLLRNAVDHGCELPAERRRRNKPAETVVKLEARHSAGHLLVSVADNGRGIDLARLREAVVRKNLVSAAVAEKLSEPELLEFLFLPGFSTREAVTEISGRGVGLDVVRDMVKSVRGKIHVSTRLGEGTRFQLQLPITLSVIRALLVSVADEPYAVPLAQIVHTLKLPRAGVQSLEGRQYFAHGGEQAGLVDARRVFGCEPKKHSGADLAVVVLGERTARYGLAVDRFLGQGELVVQPLDPRLGRVRNISAAATMEDGSPVLIVDVEDLTRSVERLAASGSLREADDETTRFLTRQRKRVLVVDDSPTVRELERKLLSNAGYLVDLAVDGLDGWNAAHTEDYDLIITDVDMPRMDGLELTALIKADARLRGKPVLMVSHKDREEDRRRGLAAGANEYFTKSGFQDQNLLQTIHKLIGEPTR
jgi:two-component system sensor histidine kinase and response regulator WspE